MPYVLPLNPTDPIAGHALLIRADNRAEASWWVSVDPATATVWAIPGRARTLLGTITRIDGGWQPVATPARTDLRRRGDRQATMHLPPATTMTEAARLLVRHWQTVDRPEPSTATSPVRPDEWRTTIDVVLGIYALLD
jgi:hypothetical protein